MLLADSLVYRYPQGKRPALENVSLRLREGEMLAVLGSNGSGKSTLARCLGGLLYPQQGKIILGDLAADSPPQYRRLRSHAAVLFANPDSQIIGGTVEDNLAFGLEQSAVNPAEMGALIRHTAEVLGISQLLTRQTRYLSGGEKQLVALGGLLVFKPRFLILDEPTAMLDAPHKERLLSLIEELMDRGMGVVLITHDLEAASLAHHCMFMEEGRVLVSGPTAEVLTDRVLLSRAGYEEPDMACFVGEMARLGVPVNPPTLKAQDVIEELCQYCLKT